LDLGLRGKRALVTAASRGLGFATASALAHEGARVALGARNASRLVLAADKLTGHNGSEAFALEMDLADQKGIGKAVATVHDLWGGIDILIVNTPGPESGLFLALDRNAWKHAIDTVLMPAIDVLHAVLPAMRRDGGRVLLITTVGVKVVQPAMVLSNSIRLALTGIAKTLSVELAAHKVLVNCLCPGPIDTDRMKDLIAATSRQQNISSDAAEAIWLDEVPLRQMGRAEDFGKLAAVLVSDAAAFVTGAALQVDGGKSRAY
jgi:3-oxoacyl-[acyl-carrier protein] reductase